MLGIENLIKVGDVVIEGGNVAAVIATMPKDAGLLQKLAPIAGLQDELLGLVSVDFSALIPEFKDIDAQEIIQWETHFKQKFHIPQAELEGLIEDLLTAIRANIVSVTVTIGVAKKFMAYMK